MEGISGRARNSESKECSNCHPQIGISQNSVVTPTFLKVYFWNCSHFLCLPSIIARTSILSCFFTELLLELWTFSNDPNNGKWQRLFSFFCPLYLIGSNPFIRSYNTGSTFTSVTVLRLMWLESSHVVSIHNNKQVKSVCLLISRL